MIAYHGEAALKDAVLNRLRGLREAGKIQQGHYKWPDGSGCAIGCTVDGPFFARYEQFFGIPIALAGVKEAVFERLTPDQAALWPERFMSAIPVGADLSGVAGKISSRLEKETECALEKATSNYGPAIQMRDFLYLSGYLSPGAFERTEAFADDVVALLQGAEVKPPESSVIVPELVVG